MGLFHRVFKCCQSVLNKSSTRMTGKIKKEGRGLSCLPVLLRVLLCPLNQARYGQGGVIFLDGLGLCHPIPFAATRLPLSSADLIEQEV